ncbi:protein NATD1 isoform X1 [Trachemys scripta elegans]|uniref:protein NATD1 isoform X1 n=1 Tax=Trachemys scripta elegans TaxID=31138 RepID=UPI0015523A09|nr:protein NATD1 isoform X1 [Trachemys scripta elegans]
MAHAAQLNILEQNCPIQVEHDRRRRQFTVRLNGKALQHGMKSHLMSLSLLLSHGHCCRGILDCESQASDWRTTAGGAHFGPHQAGLHMEQRNRGKAWGSRRLQTCIYEPLPRLAGLGATTG